MLAVQGDHVFLVPADGVVQGLAPRVGHDSRPVQLVQLDGDQAAIAASDIDRPHQPLRLRRNAKRIAFAKSVVLVKGQTFHVNAANGRKFFEQLGQLRQGVKCARIAVGNAYHDGDGRKLHFAQYVPKTVGPERLICDGTIELEGAEGAQRFRKHLPRGQDTVGVGEAVGCVPPRRREDKQRSFR